MSEPESIKIVSEDQESSSRPLAQKVGALGRAKLTAASIPAVSNEAVGVDMSEQSARYVRFMAATAAENKKEDTEHPECAGCGKRHPPHGLASVSFFELLENLSSDSPQKDVPTVKNTPATAASATAEKERHKTMALKRIADNFKHVAVSKSADRTLAILAGFETILTHMKSTGNKAFYDVTLIHDIEQIYGHVKTIYQTRSTFDFYQATDSLEGMRNRKIGGKQTERIYKYAIGAGRLLAGQIAIQFVRTKME